MGTASTLSSTLFGSTRSAVPAVLFGHVGESYCLRQLARMTGITLGPVQRELRQLVDAGLVTRKTLGTQTLVSANEASPIFAEMRAIVAKTAGIRDILLAALSPLAFSSVPSGIQQIGKNGSRRSILRSTPACASRSNSD